MISYIVIYCPHLCVKDWGFCFEVSSISRIGNGVASGPPDASGARKDGDNSIDVALLVIKRSPMWLQGSRARPIVFIPFIEPKGRKYLTI